MANLWKKFSDFLGISDPEFIIAPPLEGEIIYCKNNVCVHPPPQLTYLPKHLPGYMTIRTHGSGYLNTSLVLTWIPNISLNLHAEKDSVVSSTSESSPVRLDDGSKFSIDSKEDNVSHDSAVGGFHTDGDEKHTEGSSPVSLNVSFQDSGIGDGDSRTVKPDRKSVPSKEGDTTTEEDGKGPTINGEEADEAGLEDTAEDGGLAMRRGSSSESSTSGDLQTDIMLHKLLERHQILADEEREENQPERPTDLELPEQQQDGSKGDDDNQSVSSASQGSEYPEPFNTFLKNLKETDHMESDPTLSPAWLHNMMFPDNAISLFTNGQQVPLTNPREQLCGVFAVDLCHMRSLRIFFSDESCTSGQFVIASRESQYKILHFHHGGLDKLAEVFEHWQHCIKSLNRDQPGGETTDLCRKFTIIQSGLKAKDCHPEEGIYGPVNEEIWKSYVNERGQVEEPYALRKAIFFGGIDKNLRAEIWPFLLGMFEFESSEEDRLEIEKTKTAEYEEIKKKRASMTKEEKELFWKNVRCTVEKDVIRTDRSNPYFHGKNNPNLDVMCNILLNYAVYNPAQGYNQGMSDLLAPIMVELQNECESFWCFASLMENVIFVSSPKDEDMERQLAYLRELMKLMLPGFWKHLEKIENSMELLFCHRWILLCFKREFPEADALRIWEACWAHYQTDYFHLFVCLAIIALYGDDIVQQKLPADDMLLHFSNLSMQMNADLVLRKARAMLHRFRTLPSIPCTLDDLCRTCGTGMWDSGHSPVVECVGSHEEGYRCIHIR